MTKILITICDECHQEIDGENEIVAGHELECAKSWDCECDLHYHARCFARALKRGDSCERMETADADDNTQLIADANLGREVRRSLPYVGTSDTWSLAGAGIWGPLMRTAWEQLREDGEK